MNNLKVNYLIILVITLLATMVIGFNVRWPNTQDSQINRIISQGELRISAVSSPLIYIDEQKQLRGFDYELAQGFASYLGVKLKITIRPNFEQIFDDLENGDADIAVAGLLYNKERLAKTKTGPSYLNVTQQLVYRKGTTRPKSFNDIDGKLLVTSGTAHASTLKELAKEYPNLKWEETSQYTTNQILEMLADGEIDYTLEDSIAIALQQRIHPQIAVAFDLLDDHAVTWYMRRSQENSLDAALLDFFNLSNESELLARLNEKYFSHVESFDYFDTMAFIKAIDNKLPDYQPLFEKYAQQIDWKLLAAIAWQESHWDPLATSPTGVRGLMMLTKPTAATMGIADRLDAEESIKGGAAYIAYIMDRLPETIAEDDRIWFALSAYNMGYGHMQDVRKLTEMLGGDPNRWFDVKARLPLLTQKKYYSQLTYGYARGHEAYRYVENIRRYHQSLVGYLQSRERKQHTLDIAQKSLTYLISPDNLKTTGANPTENQSPITEKVSIKNLGAMSSSNQTPKIHNMEKLSLGHYLISPYSLQDETETDNPVPVPPLKSPDNPL
ncbi:MULTISPECIES: membrane-bound lytic murein transglycosylase MltF [Providencia]|uniref:Membrane-bound lytic murein transglycosylase F n=1 Tax=Providencia rettgeri TaxID=587 RepID=A0AAP2JVC1_PRORE|nr:MULTISPECIES: membrane-bound lytic murein transglycosylase MltF [Providencia]HCI96219.1 membrane-bound lytic murein transglycosylase MltF [Providencia sp.]EIU7557221.1 membrane-bound lytic murein transglycosylase MltF [Providencia rettgeri]EJD6043651.1 membrane-bound lytic murein transglycosylase MltF [Providencia rettgeri]EJD6080616.1 membrane-bound lytic murein transglycosylase MltF [Providencia rettgeri]EJD6598539.1 membrane-bound lytic murein transglycosylase MltF [Providencia rettgeri]